ncbi:MAG TPA: N-succinylarginine dihydrolase [Pirellulaceae bacterium]|nr:N-succinylarginine dihydrolase [Pirellulaceae bacterium]
MLSMSAREFNFDGLVGPTHNYAGLSYGNVASARHRQLTSNPRAAALEGLAKMRRLFELGLRQAVLPPQPRPDLGLLRALGFTGTPAAMIDAAFRSAPALLSACYSASSMWTANAATVSPSADCHDGCLHITPANLTSMLHRSIEAHTTTRNLRAIFARLPSAVIHDPLPASAAMSDEGAANHTRFCAEIGEPGVELFVFGRSVWDSSRASPKQFPARQTEESCRAIARRHHLHVDQVVFAQQHPDAIDAGVFHNDVISVGNQGVFLVHEMAFVNQAAVLDELAVKFARTCHRPLQVLSFRAEDFPIADVVTSYFFNSQLVTRPDGRMTLICPTECVDNPAARRAVERVIAGDNPIDQVEYLNLRQSMNNGGGPACLRLRMVLDAREAEGIAPGVIFTPLLHDQLSAWVIRHYREELAPNDLRDPHLMDEALRALSELPKILGVPLCTEGL